MHKAKAYLTKQQALQKLEHYCIYQDRCQQEVKQKMYDLGVYGSDADDILVELIQHNFVNEERFAKAYVSGKYKLKRWGRLMIVNKLKAKGISAYCIEISLKEIDEGRYLENLKYLIEKKKPTIKVKRAYQLNQKLANFLMTKGYESELIWRVLNDGNQ